MNEALQLAQAHPKDMLAIFVIAGFCAVVVHLLMSD